METNNPLQSYVGKKAIVRANVAGVHVGVVESIDGTSVVLKNPRRLWRYFTHDKSGAVSGIAATGLKKGADHQVGPVLPSVLIVNPPGLELAEMTDEAFASVMEYK